MLVQTYFPQRLSASRYDALLAAGWFRGSVMMYKMDLLCIEGAVRSVVNIRLDLEKYSFRKSHRKLLRKGDQRFRVVIETASPCAQKEQLYTSMKERFKGFIHPTLSDYLNNGVSQNVFDTRQVCVYDGDRLVAVSFFDCGERALASLLGLYDSEYSAHSLGIYTMLKEVEFGLNEGFRWYYPGYILDKESQFDYKLRLGEFEYYTASQRWGKFENFAQEHTKSHQLSSAINALSVLLDVAQLPYRKVLYPLFSMGYIGYWNAEFVKYPVFLAVELHNGEQLQFAYDLDLEVFVVNKIALAPEYDHLINMEASSDFTTTQHYCMNLLMIIEHLMLVPKHEVGMLTVFAEEARRKWYR
jgi:arginine-tRNA-protein transferase